MKKQRSAVRKKVAENFKDLDRDSLFNHLHKGDGLAALKKWMRMAGMRNDHMAEKLGLTKFTFSRYLNGKQVLPLHHQVVIQHITNGLIRPEDFINPRTSAFLNKDNRREGIERILAFKDEDLL